MQLRTILATAAIAATLVTGGVCAPATAATSHRENDLRTFCNSRHHVACVETADDDEGLFVVRDQHGHRHHLAGTAAAIRYFRHHAPACKEEDSPRCYWDATSAGNHYGDSYIVIGGKHGGEGVVWYLANLD